MDCSCYLFLLVTGDMVLFVEDFFPVRVLTGLESGHVEGEVGGGE